MFGFLCKPVGVLAGQQKNSYFSSSSSGVPVVGAGVQLRSVRHVD